MLNFTLKLVEIQILRIFVVYNIIIIFLKIRIGILKALIRNWKIYLYLIKKFHLFLRYYVITLSMIQPMIQFIIQLSRAKLGENCCFKQLYVCFVKSRTYIRHSWHNKLPPPYFSSLMLIVIISKSSSTRACTFYSTFLSTFSYILKKKLPNNKIQRI